MISAPFRNDDEDSKVIFWSHPGRVLGWLRQGMNRVGQPLRVAFFSPMRLPRRDFRQVENTLKTGDLVLFSGNGIVGRMIRFATRSPWSHVGMVIRDQSSGALLLWEATTFSNVPDVCSGEILRGVSLVPLEAKIVRYPGSVAIRRLHTEHERDQAARRIQPMLQILQGAPYRKYLPGHLWSYIRPQMRWLGPKAGTFCSEMVLVAYQRMGLVQRHEPPAARSVPGDFMRLSLKQGRLSRPGRVR